MSFASVTIKATPWKVKDLALLKREGRLCLPDLQRGFVWAPERVRALHESLYRRYPVGALLLWKPTWEGNEAPFLTRPWDLAPPNAATKRGEPEPAGVVLPGSVFVLDGQQRLTSLFRVIFSNRLRGKVTPDPELLVSLSPDPTWVENPFHLKSRQVFAKRRDGLLVQADVLFAALRGETENLAVQQAIGDWVKTSDELFFKALDRANVIRNAVLEAEIVAYEIDAEAEDDNVIEIFARLNQQGVRLRSGDLAAARLTGKMRGFREKANTFLQGCDLAGFSVVEGAEDKPRGGGYLDTDLLVRTALFLSSGVIRYSNVEKRKRTGGTEDDSYAKVEVVWDRACQALAQAVSIFRDEKVPDGGWVPYRYLLVPPAIAWANGKLDRKEPWLGWAIAASLWGIYAGSVETKVQADAKFAAEEGIEKLLESAKGLAKRSDTLIPDVEDVREQIVQEAGMLLALLVDFMRRSARSFPSSMFLGGGGQPIEVHHIFPRAALNKLTYQDTTVLADRLGNLTLLNRDDNEHISDENPSSYLPACKPVDIETHCIPTDQSLWDISRYADFCAEREQLLADRLAALLKGLGVS